MFHNFRRVSPAKLQELVANEAQVWPFLAAPAPSSKLQISRHWDVAWILAGIEVLFVPNGEGPVYHVVFRGQHLSGDPTGESNDEAQYPTRYFPPEAVQRIAELFEQFPTIPPEAAAKLQELCETGAEQMRRASARQNVDIHRFDIWLYSLDDCVKARDALSTFFRDAAGQGDAVVAWNTDRAIVATPSDED